MQSLAIRRVLGWGLVAIGLALVAAPAGSQEPVAAAPPAQVQELLRLLDDPGVRRWLDQARPEAPASLEPRRSEEVETAAIADAAAMQGFVARRLDLLRRHFGELTAAAPRLPGELAAAGRTLLRDLEGRGALEVALLVSVFAGLGLGAQRLFFALSGGWRRRIVAAPLVTVGERLRIVGERLAASLLFVLAFAVGSLGAFLLFDWPPVLERVVAAGLIVFLGWRVTVSVGRFLLAPGGPRFRILPMAQPAAEHWFVWLQIAAVWFGFGTMLHGVLTGLGTSPPVGLLIAYAFGLVLLAIGLAAVWRRPAQRDGLPGARTHTVLISVWFGLLWLAWFAGATPLFWLLVVGVALPAAIAASRRAVNHLLRPPGADADADEPPGLVAAALERGVRIVLVLVALWLLVRAFGLDVESMSAGGDVGMRLLRGVFDAVLILMVADFAWALARTWIDGKLAGAGPGPGALPGDGEGGGTLAADLDPAEVRRRARLQTLLPILRNMGFVVLATMAVLMALSALGLQIGPLLAGAGVVGVAVGFGAQTIVKDVISGMFYLLDDAFRVGEYIQSGSYKGTVEGFSLRSIRLRHHRGPLFIVPFGELGAIENMSRDWAIDKLTMSVPFDTDLDQVKRIIKGIGKELAAEPEFAPHILQTLKMQGVEQFGEYAIEIRMKMMTRPGEQFVIRRRAYALIKKAFAANGIAFASPTVTVAGGEQASAAAAQAAVELTRKPPEAA